MTVGEVAIIGAGMHPWGKWGRNFVEYGVAAAREALDDARVRWRDVQFVSGANTVRCGYPGYVSGSTFAKALGFTGCQVASSYAACASGTTALSIARAQILSNVWGYDFNPHTNFVEVHIKALREKISRFTPTSFIKSVRGVGYTIET